MWVKGHSSCEFMHDMHIFEIYLFAADTMDPSLLACTQRAADKAM